MPKNKTEYTVFISSPSDVAEERQVVSDVVDKINRLRANRPSTLKSLTWENDVLPSFGKKPQALINDATEDKYDIFLGIMCARFGTKTDSADSGTEEEFRIAYERKLISSEELEVLFYFKDPWQSKQVPAATQLLGVEKFKEKMTSDYHGI